jgi:hypothetical protein
VRGLVGTSVVDRWRALNKRACWSRCTPGMPLITKDECQMRACEYNELFQKDCCTHTSRQVCNAMFVLMTKEECHMRACEYNELFQKYDCCSDHVQAISLRRNVWFGLC